MRFFLGLVSKPENEDNKSRSSLDARDCRRFFLGLVSKPEIKCQKFSVSSRCVRLSRRNFLYRLEIEKVTLADLWLPPIALLKDANSKQRRCPKTFASRGSLWKHKQIHNGVNK